MLALHQPLRSGCLECRVHSRRDGNRSRLKLLLLRVALHFSHDSLASHAGAALFHGDSEIDTIFQIFKKFGTPTEDRKIGAELKSLKGPIREAQGEWPGLSELPDFKPTFPQWPPEVSFHRFSYGHGSKPMVPCWGGCTTHFSLFEWELGYSLGVRGFDPWSYGYDFFSRHPWVNII